MNLIDIKVKKTNKTKVIEGKQKQTKPVFVD